jgi:hypothetical protein
MVQAPSSLCSPLIGLSRDLGAGTVEGQDLWAWTTFFFFFVVLGFKLRASYLLGK